jgi:anaerobic selenocysteine-containing dehydrogenase
MAFSTRRAFIKLAVGGALGIGLTPIPYKITDDISIWTQNWPWIPKIPKRNKEYISVASKLCPGGTGVKVAMCNGLPIAVTGDPEHPTGQGGVSSMAMSEVPLLYSPARIKEPLARKGGSLQAVSWEEAERILAEKLQAAGVKVAAVSGDETGTSDEIFQALVENLGGDFYSMPSEARDAAAAWKAMGGNGQVGYDLENADHILLLGADAFESWGTPARNSKVFADTHPTGGDSKANYVYCGPVKNGTAMICDGYVPALPGSAKTLALGIARILLESGANPTGVSGLSGFKREVAAYTPEKVEKLTGVKPGQLKAMAKGLMRARRPLVIAGSGYGQGTGACAVMAGLAVNVLLGRVGEPGGIKNLPEAPKVAAVNGQAKGDAVSLFKNLADGKADYEVLLVHEANPAYALPEAERLAKAVSRVPFKVSFSSFMDETTEAADLVLPQPLTLERLDDAYTPYGSGVASYSVIRPLVKPAHSVKSAADVAIQVAKRLGKDLGVSSLKEAIEAKAEALGANPGELAQGKAWVGKRQASLGGLDLSRAAGKPEARENGSLMLAAVARQSLGTPRIAIPPHGVSTIRNSELKDKNVVVQMNSRTASEQGLREGDNVTLGSSGGRIAATVKISEKVMNGVAAVPMGFGHTAWDDFSRGKGDNVNKIFTAAREPETETHVWTGTQVNVAKA